RQFGYTSALKRCEMGSAQVTITDIPYKLFLRPDDAVELWLSYIRRGQRTAGGGAFQRPYDEFPPRTGRTGAQRRVVLGIQLSGRRGSFLSHFPSLAACPGAGRKIPSQLFPGQPARCSRPPTDGIP